MLNTTSPPELNRAIQIAEHIEARRSYFKQKADRARSRDNIELNWSRFQLYDAFGWRASKLISSIRFPKPFGSHKFNFLKLTPEEYKKRESDRVLKGKIKFETLHTYSPWFFGTGLHQDYGTYVCDSCQTTFHHSPSRIKRANQVVYECTCGYCVNDIIVNDYKCKAPFE